MVAAHDFGRPRWGRDLSWTPDPGSEGRTGKAVGWGSGMRDGDFILMSNGNPNSRSSYRIVHIEYFSDPTDMWRAKLEYDPRGVDIANRTAKAVRA